MADEFISNTDMEVVHREADFPDSRTPSRGTEPSGQTRSRGQSGTVATG